MRPRALLIALLSLVAAGVCARLGAWQLGRLAEKRRINAEWNVARTAAAVALDDARGSLAPLALRRVRAAGAYDESLHVLVSDRWWKDSAGVEVMTPLRLARGGVLLVDRGWLPAADGITARPQACREPGPRTVTGVLVPIASPRRAPAGAWTRLAGDDAAVWSVRALDPDSLRAHVPYALAPFVLRALPESLAPEWPRRLAPEPEDEGMHLSYAVQWFLFASAFAAGAVFVLAKDRDRPPAARPPAAA